MDELFSCIITHFKTYPYHKDIYALRDIENTGYLYVTDINSEHEIFTGKTVIPVFYEEIIAKKFTVQNHLNYKNISYEKLNILHVASKYISVDVVFFTTLDRRNIKPDLLRQNMNRYKKEFHHVLIDKAILM